MAARAAKGEVKQEKRRRRSGNIGKAKMNLAIPEEVRYKLGKTHVPRWFNDEGNRLYKALVEDDWDLVSSEGDLVEYGTGSESGAHRYQVGRKKDGSPLWAYLAVKRKEFYEEDKAEAQKAIDEKMNQHRSGEAAKEIGQGYVPSSGIKIS